MNIQWVINEWFRIPRESGKLGGERKRMGRGKVRRRDTPLVGLWGVDWIWLSRVEGQERWREPRVERERDQNSFFFFLKVFMWRGSHLEEFFETKYRDLWIPTKFTLCSRGQKWSNSTPWQSFAESGITWEKIKGI